MRLKQHYIEKVQPELKKELSITNDFAVPRITKIVVNIGMGDAMSDKKAMKEMADQLALITGQKPKVTHARKAIATFKLRAGMPIGLKITLRGNRMYDFLEKLITIALPRERDFRGLRKSIFDRDGNLNIGLSEFTIFPEVEYEGLTKVRGMEVTIVNTAKNKEEGQLLMGKIGIPFVKEQQ